MRKPFGNRKIAKFAVASLAVFILTCSLKLGDSPIGPPVNQPQQSDTNSFLTVTAVRTELKADGSDTTTITATLLDGRNNPLRGETIRFSCNVQSRGTIDPSAVVSQSGTASVTLTSGRVNDTCWVIAVAPLHNDTARVSIVFSGVQLSLETNAPRLTVNNNATITATLTDGSDRPMSGDSIAFTTSAAHFANNDSSYRTRLNSSGQATVSVTTATTGSIWVHASVNTIRLNDSIEITFDSTSVIIIGSRQFHVYAAKNQLKANHSDTTIITAILTDEKSNPVIGDTILFSCQPAGIGIIDSFAVIDGTGAARVTLRSTPVNGTCLVRAAAVKSRDTASTTVSFSGVTVRLEADVTDLRINEYATITAYLTDASGSPIGGDTITFRTRGGRFANSDTMFRTSLDPSGKSEVRLTSGTAGTAIVYAAALNTYDSMAIIYTNNALALTAAKTVLTVGGTDSTLLTATYLDGSGAAMPNVPIMFATNAGTITIAIDTTDANGKAYSWIKSATFSGTATVVASATAGNAVIKITFAAAVVKSVKLAITPDNIGVNGGIATLTATVRDSNDNMVSGVDVNFRIIRGPGGGEYIDKPLVTAQNGIAHAQLYAGSVASMYRAVLVAASVADTADTAKLTISGEPYAISVSRPQDDTITVPKGGQMNPATFDYNVGAVVVDINGNPVADGTRVNFSMVVTGMAVHRKVFIRWSGLGSGATGEVKPVYDYPYWDIPFEDINNNFRRDENDMVLPYRVGAGYLVQNRALACRGDDVNGDGRNDFDPFVHDIWYDFDGDGKVDTGTVRTAVTDSVPITVSVIDTACKDTIIQTLVRTTPDTLWMDSSIVICHTVIRADTISWRLDTIGYVYDYASTEPYVDVGGVRIIADLYPDGHWNTTELLRDIDGDGRYDAPASGDRLWWEYENLPYWNGLPFLFDQNDFGVAVTTSVNTVGGVADAKLTYPRQLARRLLVTVNAEANGVRDRYGQRFVLPVIIQ